MARQLEASSVVFNHAPERHWRLGPSSSSRWLACPGSKEGELPENQQTEHTIRGNELHEKSAFYLGVGLPLFGNDPDTEAARQSVRDAQQYPGQRFVEFQMESTEIADFGGTIDLLVWNEDEKRVTVFDHKFGKTKVAIKDNPQLLSYCVLALERFPVAEKFTGVISQPAVRQRAAEVDFTIEQVKAHRDAIIAASKSVALVPGNQCYYCPLRHTCPMSKYPQ